MGILQIDPDRHRDSGGRGPIYYLILVALGISIFVATVGISAVAEQVEINKLQKKVDTLRSEVETYIEENNVDVYFTNDDLKYISDIEKVESQYENMLLILDELVRIGNIHSVTYYFMEFDTIKNQVTFEISIADMDTLNSYLLDIRASEYFRGYNPDYDVSGSPVNTKLEVYYSESASRG